MLITLANGKEMQLHQPQIPPKLRANPNFMATLRAIIEMEIQGLSHSQRSILKWIKDNGYLKLSDNSTTAVARELTQLAEAGLIYERNANNKTTQYLSIFVQRKASYDKSSAAPENLALVEEESETEIQQPGDDGGALQV